MVSLRPRQHLQALDQGQEGRSRLGRFPRELQGTLAAPLLEHASEAFDRRRHGHLQVVPCLRRETRDALSERVQQTEALVAQPLLEHVGQLLQLLGRSPLRIDDLRVLDAVLGPATVDERARERVLVRKVVEDARLAQADPVGELREAHGGEPPLLNHPFGFFQDMIPHEQILPTDRSDGKFENGIFSRTRPVSGHPSTREKPFAGRPFSKGQELDDETSRGTRDMGQRDRAILCIGFQNDYFAADGALHAVIEEQVQETRVLENTLALLSDEAWADVPCINLPILFSPDYSELSNPTGLMATIKEVNAFRRDRPGGETVPQLSALGDRVETLQGKTGFNAFHGTALEERLRALGVREVILTGVVTSVCLDSTGRAAAESGFGVTVLSDCSAGRSAAEHQFYCETIFPLYARVCTLQELMADERAPAS